MDPKTPERMLLAPGASSSAALRMPAREDPPPIDEHVVRPETREELVRGRRVLAMPALDPHGDQHFRLDYVLGAHVVPGYVGSTDLLTRQAAGSNFASDTCIRKDGVHPRTKGRYLEELAFEVVHEQSTKDVTDRAEDMIARGVRRVFAIFVKKGEVGEWSPKEGVWKGLGPKATIRDACLRVPLRVADLLDAARAHDAVARALVEQDNPVIVEVRRREREEGVKSGQLAVLARRFDKRLGRALTDAERATLAERLDRLGEGRLDDVGDQLAAGSLAGWLADPDAS
jgi:hypothetical protein